MHDAEAQPLQGAGSTSVAAEHQRGAVPAPRSSASGTAPQARQAKAHRAVICGGGGLTTGGVGVTASGTCSGKTPEAVVWMMR